MLTSANVIKITQVINVSSLFVLESQAPTVQFVIPMVNVQHQIHVSANKNMLEKNVNIRNALENLHITQVFVMGMANVSIPIHVIVKMAGKAMNAELFIVKSKIIAITTESA
jgi:hypothetical protein